MSALYVDWAVAADLLTSFSILVGVVGALLVVRRILRYQEINAERLEILAGRDFQSNYPNFRQNIEHQISDLNRELTEEPSSFNEVNHLLRDAERYTSTQSPEARVRTIDSFLLSLNVPIGLEVEDDLIFVLTPFEGREKLTYSAIVEAFSDWEVRVRRGDEEAVSSNLLRHIVAYMVRARIVIANVSSRNPNVMYELGIAHALGKSVIMISSSNKPLPFDIANQRILMYKSRDDLIKKLHQNVGRLLISKQTERQAF